MTLNILFLAGVYPSEPNPVSGVFIREHAKAASLFNKVAVIYGVEDKRQKGAFSCTIGQEDGIQTVRFSFRKRFLELGRYAYRRGILRAVDELRLRGWVPDIVHAHYLGTASAAVWLKRTHGLPFVYTEHSSRFLVRSLSRAAVVTLARTLREAEMILPVSRTLKEAMESYGIKGPSQVVPNVVDTEVFRPSPSRSFRNSAAKQMMTVVGAVDRCRRSKGLDDILTALRMLKQKRSDFRLIVVGEVGSDNGYQTLAAEYGLASHVILAGYKNKTDLAALMNSSSFFVLPSLYETFGCVFMEAMACGLPMVATKVGILADLDEPPGVVFVPPERPRELADKMALMLDTCETFDRDTMAEYVQERFAARIVGHSLAEIYQAALSRTRHKRRE